MLLTKLPVTVFDLIQAELSRTELHVFPWPCGYLFLWLFVAAASESTILVSGPNMGLCKDLKRSFMGERVRSHRRTCSEILLTYLPLALIDVDY